MQKYFSLQEARSWLPQLQKDLPEIRRLVDQLQQVGFDAQTGTYRPGFHPDTLEPFPKEYKRLLNLVHRLLQAGIQLRDLQRGLVDFPAKRKDGRAVFLCWQLGEEDIAWWHPLQEGFAGRRSIDSL